MVNPDKNSYKVVNLIDVHQLLSFAKKEYKEIEEQVKEDKRIEDELKSFIKLVEKHSGHKIHHIGHEKKYGTHLIRFLLKDGGFLEVIVEKPLSITGHFLDHNSAQKFVKGLKKALEKSLPDSPIKSMYIDSVKVEDGFKDEVLTLEKWSMMHKLVIHKTVVVTFVALIIFMVIELTKGIIGETAREVFKLNSIIISIISAIVIAFLIEPLKFKVDEIVVKYFDK